MVVVAPNHLFNREGLQLRQVARAQSLPAYRFDLSSGALCLDFANTVSHRHATKERAEHLNGYSDLVAFAEQSRLLSSKIAAALRVRAHRNRARTGEAFNKHIVLREALYRAFSAVAADRRASLEDVQLINDFVFEALQHRRLIRTDRDYRWEWQSNGSDLLDRILWPITQSAADLLTSTNRQHIRECGAPDCEWLFLDHSRNGSRRWCDMKSCGNRQKARRHYQRTHI